MSITNPFEFIKKCFLLIVYHCGWGYIGLMSVPLIVIALFWIFCPLIVINIIITIIELFLLFILFGLGLWDGEGEES